MCSGEAPLPAGATGLRCGPGLCSESEMARRPLNAGRPAGVSTAAGRVLTSRSALVPSLSFQARRELNMRAEHRCHVCVRQVAWVSYRDLTCCGSGFPFSPDAGLHAAARRPCLNRACVCWWRRLACVLCGAGQVGGVRGCLVEPTSACSPRDGCLGAGERHLGRGPKPWPVEGTLLGSADPSSPRPCPDPGKVAFVSREGGRGHLVPKREARDAEARGGACPSGVATVTEARGFGGMGLRQGLPSRIQWARVRVTVVAPACNGGVHVGCCHGSQTEGLYAAAAARTALCL